MKKWHQKSIAIFTAAACLLAGGTIGLSQESLSKLQLTAAAETENTNLVGASFGLELEYDYLDDGTLEVPIPQMSSCHPQSRGNKLPVSDTVHLVAVAISPVSPFRMVSPVLDIGHLKSAAI